MSQVLEQEDERSERGSMQRRKKREGRAAANKMDGLDEIGHN